MKNYDQWKNDYIRKDASRKYSSEKDLKSKYDEYINQSGESIGESMPSNKEFSDEKLDKIYDVLNHIRWIGLSIAMMFALTFVIPNL